MCRQNANKRNYLTTVSTAIEFINDYYLLSKHQVEIPYVQYNKVLIGENQANIYLLKVNTRNTSKRCEICLKITKKTPERRDWFRSGVFIVNFEHKLHLFLLFLFLTLNIYLFSTATYETNFNRDFSGGDLDVLRKKWSFPLRITLYKKWSFLLRI